MEFSKAGFVLHLSEAGNGLANGHSSEDRARPLMSYSFKINSDYFGEVPT